MVHANQMTVHFLLEHYKAVLLYTVGGDLQYDIEEVQVLRMKSIYFKHEFSFNYSTNHHAMLYKDDVHGNYPTQLNSPTIFSDRHNI
jgi:hypothetical protein